MQDPPDRRRGRHGSRAGPAPYPPYAPFPPYPPFAPYPPYPPPPPPRICPTPTQGGPPAGPEGGQGEVSGGPGGPTLPPLVFPTVVAIRRPDDLLVCTLRFVGFAFLTDPLRLDRAAPDAYVAVEFPPQSFGEEAFLLTAGQTAEAPAGTPQDPNQEVAPPPYPPQNLPASADDSVPTSLPAGRIRMSGASRVVVAMPAGQETVPFDLPSILAAVHAWPMRLAAGAVPDSSSPMTLPGPQEPASGVTSLELPYRLLLSPLGLATWRHSISPVSPSGRSELWHTRLANPPDATGDEPSSRIRAIWSPDYRPPPRLNELFSLVGSGQPPNPALIRMSLDPLDRAMLVNLMSGFDATLNNGNPYVPLSSEAKRLHLTALGGLLDAEGSWSALPKGIDLEQWRHEATLGRDHYVRVVYKGWLCPFGHAASLIKVTERRFQPLGSDASQRIAVLRQRFFVVVRQPVRPYSGDNHVHAGRDFPFTEVELLTRVTPDLVDPSDPACVLVKPPSGDDPYGGGAVANRMLFWPTVPAGSGGVKDVLFQIAATDISGARVTFAMPLLFVGKAANEFARTDAKGALKEAYNAAPAATKRQTSFGGASVAFALPNPGDQGDTTLPTADVTFWAGDLLNPADPDFYPEIKFAHVGIKPVQKLLAKPDFVAEVTYPDFYAQHGFDPTQNAGRVFLQLTNALPLQFGAQQNQPKSDALGALATPQMNVLGLSTIMGPVAGQNALGVDDVRSKLDKVKGGSFDPSDFFGDATLLGGIKLGDIVKASASLAGTEVPNLLTRDFPDHVEASFDWSTTVTQPDTQNLIIPKADLNEGDTKLVMSGVIRTPLDPAQAASFTATAELNNFKVNLFGFIILWFEDLRFDAKSGQKPDVNVQMRPGDDAVAFGGPLEFVNTLRHYIPSKGFSDPPGLVVTPSGISASYSLSLPALEVGIFALSNVALGAGFSLPFDGTPVMVKFTFSTREQPFSLAVSLLGGGGFLGIGITSDGVREIEAALEFGAVVAIDLVVASGSVEVKAGIYFHWLEPTTGNGSVELAGYVRIHGELCVLALISVALTFNLQLGYQKVTGGNSIVYGEADLTVEIDILMFSTSVSVRCRREFSGGGADPKFIEQIPTQAIWSAYCDAFATEAA
jgi:hypothetical protein